MSTALGLSRLPRKGVKLPRQKYPRDAERQYRLFLERILAAMRDEIARTLEQLAPLLPRADRAPRIDSGRGGRVTATVFVTDMRVRDIVFGSEVQRVDTADQVKKLLDDVKARMAKALDPTRVEQFLRERESAVSTWSEREFAKQARAAIGVDIFARDPKQRERAAAFVATNVERVQNLVAETANKMSALILQSVQDGKSTSLLAKEISDQFDVSERRAATIARDQTGKLYGQINADRQKALGLTRFIWRTSNDSRVREEHAELEGELFSYDDPPSEGLPGEPINCRCHAEPYFDDLLNQGES